MARLDLIIGCMFSGKSTELIKRIRANRLLDRKILCITHESDQRYGYNVIASHAKDSETAINVDNLDHIETSMVRACDLICIEEAHFFKELKPFVIKLVEEMGKHVIVCGLDGTFERKPFYNILELIPFADDVMHTKALCLCCKDGTPATFSARLTNDRNELVVGGSESYASVCRFHFRQV